jgi:DNA-binding FadR family transcriptional regulator
VLITSFCTAAVKTVDQSWQNSDWFKPIFPSDMPTKRILHRQKNEALTPAIERLRSYIMTSGQKEGERLPAERILAADLGMSRGTLRQALALAESTGEIWRHVGKGTFIGTSAPSNEDELASHLARLSSPIEVIEVRALIEPRLAALAALRGTPQGFSALITIANRGLAAIDPATSARYGNEFHRAIAVMAGNQLLLGLFDAVFKVRDLNTWGKLKPVTSSAKDLKQLWKHHAEIAKAITNRDVREAEALMRQHIDQLQNAISGQDALLAVQRSPKNWLRGL